LAVLRTGKGSAAGRKFLAPPYYSQCAVFASPLSAFYIVVVVNIILLLNRPTDRQTGKVKTLATSVDVNQHDQTIFIYLTAGLLDNQTEWTRVVINGESLWLCVCVSVFVLTKTQTKTIMKIKR